MIWYVCAPDKLRLLAHVENFKAILWGRDDESDDIFDHPEM